MSRIASQANSTNTIFLLLFKRDKEVFQTNKITEPTLVDNSTTYSQKLVFTSSGECWIQVLHDQREIY